MWCANGSECANFKQLRATTPAATALRDDIFVHQEGALTRHVDHQAYREGTNGTRRDEDDGFLYSQIDALLKEYQERMLGKIGDMMLEQTKVIHGFLEHGESPAWKHAHQASGAAMSGPATQPPLLSFKISGNSADPDGAEALGRDSPSQHAVDIKQQRSTGGQVTMQSSRGLSTASPMPNATPRELAGQRVAQSTVLGHGLLQDISRHSNSSRNVRKSMVRAGQRIDLFNMGPTPGGGCSNWREWIRYIVRNNLFELAFVVVIMSNSIFVGVQVNHAAVERSTSVPLLMFAIQTVYCGIFGIEMLMRVIADGMVYFRPSSENFGWNMLDCLVVSTSIAELIIDSMALTQDSFNAGSNVRDASNVRVIRVLRIVRMVRIVRIAKILRFIHALRTFIYSIMATIKSLIWALLLLAIIIYVFGIVITQSVSDYIIDGMEDGDGVSGGVPSLGPLDTYWGNLPKSMFTLFKSICGGLSWHDGVYPMHKVGFVWVAVFIAYISFTYFAVLNVVTGIFCHSAIETAQQNEDLVVQIQMANKKSYIDRIKRVFRQIDDDESGAITMNELEAHLSDETMQAIFTSLEIDTEDAYSLFRLLDTDGGNYIDIDEFVSGLMRLRGNAKRVDVLEIQQTLKKIGDRLTALCVHHGALNLAGASGIAGKGLPAGVASGQLRRVSAMITAAGSDEHPGLRQGPTTPKDTKRDISQQRSSEPSAFPSFETPQASQVDSAPYIGAEASVRSSRESAGNKRGCSMDVAEVQLDVHQSEGLADGGGSRQLEM